MQRKDVLRFSLIAVFLLSLSTTVFGQVGGCVDSPEDPSAVLVLLGVGAVAFPALKARITKRKHKI